MASFNLTVEDSSPLISYSPPGAWSDSSSNDTLISSYSGSSYHTTSTQGAAANISFNGTGITIFGGHRQNYGTYQISVDGQNVATESSAGQDAFQQVLGTASGLNDGPHTAVLTSSSSSPIDIDYVEIQTEIGESGSQLSSSTIDDTDPSFVYTPQSEWKVNDQNYFMNSTLHYTSSAGASASVTFSGDAVAVYTTVSQDHADIQLSLDGQTHTFGVGSGGLASTLHSKVLIYYARGLGPDQHTLSLTADPQNGTGPFIDVDAIVVYSASTGSTNAPNNSTSPPAESPSVPSTSNRSTKVLIGGIAGGILGFILLLALLFLLLRWRHRRRQSRDDMRSPPTPTLPMQDPRALEAGLPARSNEPNGFQSRLSNNSIASFYSGPSQADEGFNGAGRHSRAPSATESFSSSAPINANAVPASHSRNHSMSSNNSLLRPNMPRAL
ncbi:hypothetical protein GYMLUDRAFT_81752 [Collybiopsis luxurians FD-317 M1]|nr:hypothetical protein GYMLUDRAFT_81752 [Collybiopsis luxurians FD-317 M1]